MGQLKVLTPLRSGDKLSTSCFLLLPERRCYEEKKTVAFGRKLLYFLLF